MAMFSRHFRVAGYISAVLLGTLSLAGCGTATTVTVDKTISTTTTITPTKPFQPVRSWTWTTSNNDGYKFAVTLGTESPQRLTAVPLHGEFTSLDQLSTTCTFNAATDALLPVETKLTNATPTFSSDVQASFAIPNDYRTMNEVPQQMQVIGAINNAPSCISMGRFGGGGSRWTAFSHDTPPTQSSTTYAYLVLANYFTPSYPNGDPSLLHGIQLFVVQDVASGFIDTMTGPGVDWSPDHTATISLAG